MLSLIPVVLILFLAACGGPASPPAFTEGPRISFDQDSADAGEATPEQQVYYEFPFQNVGSAPLVISKVTAKTLEGC